MAISALLLLTQALSPALYTRPASADPVYPELITQNDAGQQANGSINGVVAVSDNGRYVAYSSLASNLDDRHTIPSIGDAYVYVRDRVAATTRLVSQGTGTTALRFTEILDISGDGQYVFFMLNRDYEGRVAGIYRYAVGTEEIELITTNAANYGSSSYNGNFLVVAADDGNTRDVVRIDISSGDRITIADGPSYPFGQISSDGNQILYVDSMAALRLYTVNSQSSQLLYQGTVTNPSPPGPIAISKNQQYAFFNSSDTGVTSETIPECYPQSCAYRVNISNGEIKAIKASYGGEMIHPRFDGYGLVSGDGNVVVVNDEVDGQPIGSRVETGMLYINVESGESYPVGYGPNWEVPTPLYTQAVASLSADTSEVFYYTSASNSGLTPNCSNESQPEQFFFCSDIFVTSTAKNPNSTGGTTTLPASADNHVRSGQDHRNYGALEYMRLQASGDNRSLIKFDENAIEAAIGNGTLTSATLQLTIVDNGNNWGATGRDISLHRLLKDWTEGNGDENNRGNGNGSTWACAVDSIIENQSKNCSGITEWTMGQPNNPAVHPWQEAATDNYTITNGLSGTIELDVTSDVQAFIDGDHMNYGWLIKRANESQNGMVSFGTKESATAPELVLTFE